MRYLFPLLHRPLPHKFVVSIIRLPAGVLFEGCKSRERLCDLPGELFCSGQQVPSPCCPCRGS